MYDFLPVALYLGCENKFLQCCHGGMEIGYNPNTLLDAPSSVYFEWLTELNRHTNAQHWDIDTVYPFTNVDLTKTTKNDSSVPFINIGFMWSDFLVDSVADHAPVEYQMGRGYQYGKWATKKILLSGCTEKNLVLGVLRAHQHSPGDEMWASIMANNRGLSTLWQDTPSSPTTINLWPGIVCTFLVAPDTPYGKKAQYNFDAFGILKMTAEFKDWQLTVHQNTFDFK